MEGVPDLQRLGQTLRARREALGLTRNALSRRIDVTRPYIWLVESATPRKNGHPSRPRRATLVKWIGALEMEERDANDVLRWAGYASLSKGTEAGVPRSLEEPPKSSVQRSASPADGVALQRPKQLDLSQPRELQRATLLRRTGDLLDRAGASDASWEEVVTLLDTLLDFASHRLEGEH